MGPAVITGAEAEASQWELSAGTDCPFVEDLIQHFLVTLVWLDLHGDIL